MKAAAAAAKSAADKKSADAASAVRVKRAKAAIASAAKAAAQKAADRAASAESTAQTKAQMLGAPSRLASAVAPKKQRMTRRSPISSVDNEVKFYRGHECSMAAIFPDDAEFARACARLRRAEK